MAVLSACEQTYFDMLKTGAEEGQRLGRASAATCHEAATDASQPHGFGWRLPAIGPTIK